MRFLIIVLILLPLSGQAAVSVVTSIEPLYLITKSIMNGVEKPELLIKRRASAHHFAFKPSSFRLLQGADLVIWIDRQFESGFQQLPQILRKSVIQLELLRTLGLQQQDGHIWYSPILLKRMAFEIRDALGRVDPQHSDTYTRNASELADMLSFWQQESGGQIKAANPLYLLDHDFLRYFENDIGIKAIAVLHDSNDQPASIRTLQMIEESLLAQPATCLLTNEATASKLARNLARKFNLKIYSIAEDQPIGDDSSTIIQTLDQLRTALLNCR